MPMLKFPVSGILRRLYKFSLIGIAGTLINMAMFYFLTSNFRINYLHSAAISTEAALIFNFMGNNFYTFKDRKSGRLIRKFAFFQFFSLSTIALTLILFYSLISIFGADLVMLWNLLAIGIVSLFNFAFNSKITWGADEFKFNFPQLKIINGFKGQFSRNFIQNIFVKKIPVIIFAAVMLSVASNADILSVSQMGYHPNSWKQAVLYTSLDSAELNIKQSGTDQIIAGYTLQKPKDYHGSDVKCQGNMPCLVGDFSTFKQEGTFYVESGGVKSKDFKIGKNILKENAMILLEFFNAQLQQNSAYHADINNNFNPPFLAIADGSFIMEADQAALSLIRLGSAYRRNKGLFSFDNYNIISSGQKDIIEYIVVYANYLKGLQGVQIQQGDFDGAIRLGSGMKIERAFVPGPTELQSIDVYIPGNPPTKLETVPVVSLCGADDGTSTWDKCIEDAAFYYKCQVDEPCLDIKYNDAKGLVISNNNGFGISKGWGYEFGCFFDVDLQQKSFDGKPNPCLVFYPEVKREYSSMALLGFLEAYPAVSDYSDSEGQALLQRAKSTYAHIKEKFSPFSANDADVGFFGAALFLLYDYIGDSSYLSEAHSLRGLISRDFISDKTRGNEFYWEEYIRHKNHIQSQQLEYAVDNNNPEEFFRGKIFGDYKDKDAYSISSNGERVYQFDNNIQFQNSRYILTEGLLAAKAAELHPSPENFIAQVSEMQVAWLTGMNAIQQGVGIGSPVKPMSFILGIGDFPKKFHSRWLIDTGYSKGSAGDIIGARGTNYQFLDASTNKYEFFDGKTEMLGYKLGALGNKWKSEQHAEPYNFGKTFKNGKDYIPGWINGPFDTNAEGENDVILNYKDDVDTYEFTETTNEIVATALELFAYLDGRLENEERMEGVAPLNETNQTNQSNSLEKGNIAIKTNVPLVDIYLNFDFVNSTDVNGDLFIRNKNPGTYSLLASKDNFGIFTNTFTLQAGQNLTINIVLSEGNSSNLSASNAEIISSGTSLQKQGSNYYMREDASALFYIESSSMSSINWYIDGELVSSSTGANATFLWKPGVLFVPRAPDFSSMSTVTIKGQSEKESISWKVNVENVVNPFFSNVDDSQDIIGSDTTKLHVITNKNIIAFTNLSVTLENTYSGGSKVYTLQKTYEDQDEEDWTLIIKNIPAGNNYLTKISGFKQDTQETVQFDVEKRRAHYRTIPSQQQKEFVEPKEIEEPQVKGLDPKLVYIAFEKDIVKLNETQKVLLDAKNFDGGVQKVFVKLLGPDGKQITLILRLIMGTSEYGTWSAEFSGFTQGTYKVQSVVMGRDDQFGMTEIKAEKSFYAVDEVVLSNEKLALVYTLLSHSVANNGTNVTLTLDARDALGLTKAFARVQTTNGDQFELPLELISGNLNYGTWQGSFIVTQPDATYSVTSVLLENQDQKREYQIKDRSVYVRWIASKRSLQDIREDFQPFSKKHILALLRKPLVPAFIGLGLMFLVMGAMIVAPKQEEERFRGKKDFLKSMLRI